jgi:hypothetical protein
MTEQRVIRRSGLIAKNASVFSLKGGNREVENAARVSARSSGNWAVANDGAQWVLWKARKGNSQWYAVSFVRSTKEVLARCMREKGTPGDVAARLLAALPDRFGHEHVSAALIQHSTKPVVSSRRTTFRLCRFRRVEARRAAQ